jgi:hypothetical protein
MNQREAWEALSAAFEKAKDEYYRKVLETDPFERKMDVNLQYLHGRFNGLCDARELLAPYLQPK